MRVLVAGLVIGRQRPGTADGTCFITLEDEYGHVNVVVWGRDYERWRTTIITSRVLLVDAVIEREGIVIHAMARGVVAVSTTSQTFVGERADTSSTQMALPFASRDFH
jgi:error-prone DNA polymerase